MSKISYETAAIKLGERLASLEGSQEVFATKSDLAKIEGQLESLARKEDVAKLSISILKWLAPLVVSTAIATIGICATIIGLICK